MKKFCSKEHVSIVIPTSNRAQELKRAIKSTLNQTHKNIEVIVVCNNTNKPEEIIKICEEFCCKKIKYHHLKNCENANVARNYGVKMSTGSYIAFLDSDDEWEADHIENCLRLIKEHNSDFIYGATKIFDGDKYITKQSRDISPNENPVDFLLGFKRGYAQTSSYLIKRSCFTRVSWDERLKRHQDYDFFIKACQSFKSKSNQKPDSIINWTKGEKRNYDQASVELFLKKYKKTMKLTTRLRYHLLMIYVSIARKSPRTFLYFLTSLFKY